MTSAAAPVLSVIVPVYQVEDFLAECLDSVLAEAGDDLEIVAVDDKSPDGSGAILDHYARRDRRVRVIHLATNVGLGRARNAGLEAARGDYVWFVDSDDWLPPGTMPAVRERLAATDPDVLMFDHVEVSLDGQVLATGSGPVLRSVATPVRVAERPELLGLTLGTSACTKVIRRSLLEKLDLRFPPGWYEDCAFTFPLLLAADRVDALDRVGYCYRRRESGAITGSRGERHFDVFEQYDRMWARIDQDAPAPGTAAPGTAAYEALRPELFRLMIDHLLVIAGNGGRLPRSMRREFFARIVQEYHRRRPPGGYRNPGGVVGLKHRLVRGNAYPIYAALRLAWRSASRLRLRRGSHGRYRAGRGAPQAANLVVR